MDKLFSCELKFEIIIGIQSQNFLSTRLLLKKKKSRRSKVGSLELESRQHNLVVRIDFT